MRRRISPRETKRLIKRMGVNMSQIPDVQQVILRMDSREIVIENPEVAVIDLQGQKIFQVTGEKVVEKAIAKVKAIPEEDIRLVADQTGKSLEEAKRALEETEGDLAKAILLLRTQK